MRLTALVLLTQARSLAGQGQPGAWATEDLADMEIDIDATALASHYAHAATSADAAASAGLATFAPPATGTAASKFRVQNGRAVPATVVPTKFSAGGVASSPYFRRNLYEQPDDEARRAFAMPLSPPSLSTSSPAAPGRAVLAPPFLIVSPQPSALGSTLAATACATARAAVAPQP